MLPGLYIGLSVCMNILSFRNLTFTDKCLLKLAPPFEITRKCTVLDFNQGGMVNSTFAMTVALFAAMTLVTLPTLLPTTVTTASVFKLV